MAREQGLGRHAFAAGKLDLREGNGTLTARNRQPLREEAEDLSWLPCPWHRSWHEDLGRLSVEADMRTRPGIHTAGTG